MKRMTKKYLEQMRQSYHIGNDCYIGNDSIHVENLVAEVEACWRERNNLKIRLKTCQGKLTVLKNKAEVGCNV